MNLIISDWNMPNMTGLEFLKKVKADPQYNHIPIIMLTAEAEKGQVLEALQSGANGYIVKPFAAASLKEKIDSLKLG